MARLGKLPVEIPEGITVKIGSNTLKVTGPKGDITRKLSNAVKLEKKDKQIKVTRANNSKLALAIEGTTRAHLINMIKGVTEGWTKSLEINGAGYRAEVKGAELVLTVGYSHPVIIELPQGIEAKVEKNVVTLSGVNKDLVGQVAANVRKTRKPNVYTGSGIKYVDEVIRRKAGKQAAKAE